MPRCFVAYFLNSSCGNIFYPFLNNNSQRYELFAYTVLEFLFAENLCVCGCLFLVGILIAVYDFFVRKWICSKNLLNFVGVKSSLTFCTRKKRFLSPMINKGILQG